MYIRMYPNICIRACVCVCICESRVPWVCGCGCECVYSYVQTNIYIHALLTRAHAFTTHRLVFERWILGLRAGLCTVSARLWVCQMSTAVSNFSLHFTVTSVSTCALFLLVAALYIEDTVVCMYKLRAYTHTSSISSMCFFFAQNCLFGRSALGTVFI